MPTNLEIESLAFNLAKEFRSYYIKYSFSIYKMSSVKKSKWWQYFLTTAQKYIEEKDFDYKFFIKTQFENHGRILPFFLVGKSAEKTYLQSFFKGIEEESRILKEIKSSKQYIYLWENKNNKNFFDENNIFILKRKIGYLSLYYLAFSKSFLLAFSKIPEEQRYEIVPTKTLTLKRVYCKQLILINKIKEIMKEDFR